MSEIKKVTTKKIAIKEEKFNNENIDNKTPNIESIELANKKMDMDNAKKALATGAVVGTSVISGILKIGENIVDGLSYVGGKTSYGIDSLIANITGLFDENGANNIRANRDENDKKNTDFIRDDLTSNLNNYIYENTDIGKSINDESLIKYDSKESKTIENVTSKVAEVAAATGLTILTGGAAAPASFACVFAPGALEGIGKQAESGYKNKTDNPGLVFLSGTLNGLSWYANGKLASGALNILQDAKSIGLDGIKTIAKDKVTNFLSDSNTRKEVLDASLSKVKNTLTGLNGIMNYTASAMMMGNDIMDVINSQDGFNPKNVGKLAHAYARNLGLNIIEDIVRGDIAGYNGLNKVVLDDNSIYNGEYESTFEDADLPIFKTKEVGNPKDGMFTIKYEDAPNLMPADTDLMHTDSINEAGDNVGINFDGAKISLNSSVKKYVDNLEDYKNAGITIDDYLKSKNITIDDATSRIDSSNLFDDPMPTLFEKSDEALTNSFGLKQSTCNKMNSLLLEYRNKPIQEQTSFEYDKVKTEVKDILKYAGKNDEDVDKIWNVVKYKGLTNNQIDPEKFYDDLKDYIDNDANVNLKKLIDNYDESYVGKMKANLTPEEKESIKIYTDSMDGCWGLKKQYKNLPAEEELKNASEITYGSDAKIPDDAAKNLASAIDKNRIEKTITLRRVAYNFNGIKGKKNLKAGQSLDVDTFLSATASKEDAEKLLDSLTKSRYGQPSVMIEIVAPKGSNAAYIEPLSRMGEYSQNEVLIGPNSKLTIIEDPVMKKIGKKQMTVIKCLLTEG